MMHSNGSSLSSFALKANSYIDATSFTVGLPGTKGYKFESTTFTNNNTDKGKVLRVGGVTSGVATVEAAYVIKPLGDGSSVAADPINTLYYVV